MVLASCPLVAAHAGIHKRQAAVHQQREQGDRKAAYPQQIAAQRAQAGVDQHAQSSRADVGGKGGGGDDLGGGGAHAGERQGKGERAFD